jgi:hypothetical protein
MTMNAPAIISAGGSCAFQPLAASSFSGILAGVGATSIARSSSREYRMFAAVPLVFAAQQAAEGVVWLTIGQPSHATLDRLAVTAFLGFALVIWPTWLPFSLRLVEQDPARRRALTGLVRVGAIISMSAAALLIFWRPAASIVGHSIHYDYGGSSDLPRRLFVLLAYLVPTIVPLFVSTRNLARTIGVTLAVSWILTLVIQRNALTSVWCFFAAILSGLVVIAVGRPERSSSIGSLVPVP